MWIEILKEGKFKDANGIDREFSSQQLEDIATKYNQSISTNKSQEAPLVLGHPTADSPAYGWVESLRRYGKKLLAQVKDISTELIDDVKTGKYKNVSVSLYPDLSLRHIGVLGGTRPAVAGLEPISFSEAPLIDISSTNSLEEKEATNTNIEYENRIKELENEIRINKLNTAKKGVSDFCTDLENKNLFGLDKEKIEELNICLCEMLAHEQSVNPNIDFAETSTKSSAMKFVSLLKNIKTEPNLSSLKLNRKIKTNKSQTFDFSENTRLQKHERALDFMQSNTGISYEEALKNV